MSKELRRELHHPKDAKVVAEPPNERKTTPLSYLHLHSSDPGLQKALFGFKILKQLLPTRIISSPIVTFWEFIGDKNMK